VKKLHVICTAVCILILLSACGSGSASSAEATSYPAALESQSMKAAYDNAAPQAEAPAPADAGMAGGGTVLASGRYTGESWNELSQPEKIIKTGNVELSTNHFDNDKIRLETLTKQMGGFIEQSNIYGIGGSRRYEAVLRVPGDRFSDMKKAVEETGKLVSAGESTNNVTGQYYDTVERLSTKKIEEERVLDMIGKADNVDTLLNLEEYLGRIRTDIYQMESQIKDIDNLSSYSTINVTMTEGLNVILMADTGNFGQKLWQNFKSSANATASFFGNILVFLAGAAIPLALIALVAAAGLIAYRKLLFKNLREGVRQ